MKECNIDRRDFLSGGAAMLAAAATSCRRETEDSRPAQALTDPHQATFESALARLLERQSGDAFLIFEEKPSRKFVQYTRSDERTLCMDLPSQTLNKAEMERARAFFIEYGIRPHEHEYDVFDRPGGNVAGRQFAFQKDFGRDVQSAAEVASGVFRRVYRFPAGFELGVTEN